MIIHVLYNLCFLLIKRIGVNLGCNVAVEPCAVVVGVVGPLSECRVSVDDAGLLDGIVEVARNNQRIRGNALLGHVDLVTTLRDVLDVNLTQELGDRGGFANLVNGRCRGVLT